LIWDELQMEFRRSQAIRRMLAFALALLSLGLAAPLHAQQGVFTVSGIAVDVTGASAEAARRQAVDEGHLAAMARLLERLLPEAELARAPELDAAEIARLVQDFGVEAEKSSNVRYLATMTFRFKPAAVRDLFRLYGLTYAETQGPRMLVLPVFGRGGAASLWEEPNPWWQVWAVRPSDEGLIPFVTPLGDLSDVSAIDAGGALGPDQARLSAIAERYGVEDQLVTQAILSGDADAGQALLEVVSRRYGRDPAGPFLRRYKQGDDEDLTALLRRAVAGEAGAVERSWKEANLLEAGLQNRIRGRRRPADRAAGARRAGLDQRPRSGLAALSCRHPARCRRHRGVACGCDGAHATLWRTGLWHAGALRRPRGPVESDACAGRRAASGSLYGHHPVRINRLLGHVPNLITLARLLAVPVIVYLVLYGAYTAAFWVFLIAGVSDALDGALARRLGLKSVFGAFLDPLADKALLISVYVVLGYVGAITAWLVILIVFRDLLILGGALLFHTMFHRLTVAPLFVSKINTACQIAFATLVLADLGLEVALPRIQEALIYLVAATTLISGAVYVVKWGRLAMTMESKQ
jgi:cardiolipin synthase